MKNLLIVVGFFLVLFLINKILKRFKVPKIGSLALVTGGVKCGKSTTSVALVMSEYRSRVRCVKFRNFFRKLFNKPLQELPLIYSNIPLACPYVPLTDDLLLRKKRFVYGSVIYCQEASLVADSQLLKDKDINERLLLFNKLIGHETKGGCLIYDTQCIGDLHYSIKRCVSEYIYVHHLVKWLPFMLVAYVEENRYSDDGSVISTQDEDIEYKLRKVILSKKNWKYFDAYCYSCLTDNLPVENTLINNNIQTKNLKAENIISFRENFKKVGVKNENENNE